MTTPSAEILAQLRALQAHDLPAHGGRTLAYVYDSGLSDANELGLEALTMFTNSNGLDPTAFPSLLQMENDLVAWAARLLDGTDAVGTATSGGTESILMAVLAARESRRDLGSFSMVIPDTAHAAFHKAAHYFGVRLISVPVDASFRGDPAAMAAAIESDTILVVASAPSYAHGVIDPVGEIAAAAAERGVRCHVDACIGGWVLPHLTGEAGDPTTPWTFAVPGVTSISVDLHKYAYTPKGISLLLHRDAGLRRPQFFASAQWPGYTMLNSTMQSTKSGGPLAAAWAVVHAIGDDGYADLARRARNATLAVAEAVNGIDGLSVVTAPDSTLIALAADERCDVFTIADQLLAMGWFVQPQMSHQCSAPTLHLTLSAATASHIDEFTASLAEAVTAAQTRGPIQLPEQLAGMVAAIDPATLDEQGFGQLLAAAGLVSGDGTLALPERMAPVNALLNIASPELRETLLLAFLDQLSRPSR